MSSGEVHQHIERRSPLRHQVATSGGCLRRAIVAEAMRKGSTELQGLSIFPFGQPRATLSWSRYDPVTIIRFTDCRSLCRPLDSATRYFDAGGSYEPALSGRRCPPFFYRFTGSIRGSRLLPYQMHHPWLREHRARPTQSDVRRSIRLLLFLSRPNAKNRPTFI